MLKNKLSVLAHKRSTYALAAAGIVMFWWFSGASGDSKPSAPPVHVTAAPAQRQDVPMQVSQVGRVVAYETVAIKSRLDSQIMEVRFHDGDVVKEGQPMFILDDRAIKAQIEQLEAALEKEKAQLIDTQLQYERAQKLIKTHVVAQAQVDDAKAAYEAQQAQVNAAQANLDNQRVQLTYTVITAPISGRTGTINVTRGNNVKANDTQALVTINQITPIRIQYSIPQRYYDQVRTALSQGNVNVTAQNKESKATAQGKLEYVDNSIDVSNGTFSVRAVFANEDEKLWPGMFVNVTTDLGLEKNAVTVPAVAVQGDEDSHFVFTIVNGDNGKKKALRKPVEISVINSEIAIVTKGIDDGDQVIIDGILRVTDGATLDVTPSANEVTPAKNAQEESPKS